MLFLLARSWLLSFVLDTFFTLEQLPLSLMLSGNCSVLLWDSSADNFYTLQPMIAHNLKNLGPQFPLKVGWRRPSKLQAEGDNVPCGDSKYCAI